MQPLVASRRSVDAVLRRAVCGSIVGDIVVRLRPATSSSADRCRHRIGRRRRPRYGRRTSQRRTDGIWLFVQLDVVDTRTVRFVPDAAPQSATILRSSFDCRWRLRGIRRGRRVRELQPVTVCRVAVVESGHDVIVGVIFNTVNCVGC
jgi:hypothetical protein